jgi:hypothetical protein
MEEGTSPQQPLPSSAPVAPIIPSMPAIPDTVREPLPLPLKAAPEPQTRTPPAIIDPNIPLSYSRVVKITVGQQVDIPFTGSGWSYLGEADSQKGLTYISHRLGSEGEDYLFIAEKTGVYSLKFYKQDFVRDAALTDAVQVVVGEAPSIPDTGLAVVTRSTVEAAPRWASAATEAGVSEASSASAAPAVPQGIAETPPVTLQEPSPETPPDNAPTPDSFLQQAETAFAAGNIADTLSALDQFREYFPFGSDEVWWLYAQALEADTPARDIKSARYYYRRLINEFPLSPHYTAANNRISYLDKYFFNNP